MKKLYAFILFLLLAACTQTIENPPPAEPTQIPTPTEAPFTRTPEPTATEVPATETPQPTETPTPTATLAPSCRNFSIYSQIVQDNISIEIALPDAYAAFPDKEYTSIYLLDADYFFDDAAGTLDYLLERGEGMTKIVQTLTEQEKIPPSVLIGIRYSEIQRTQLTMYEAENFYAFFTDELIPEIEAKCNVSKSGKDRVLFGYSSSAHFSTYALMYDVYTGVETFNKFISISGVYGSTLEPYKLEEKIFQELGADAFSGRSLFIAVGASDANTELLKNHKVFAEKLTGRGYAEFHLSSRVFPGRGHYDVPEYAFSKGLIWVFSE